MHSNRRAAALAVAGTAVAAAIVATPVAAQSANRAAIDDLNEQLLYVALPLALFVEVTLFYAVYRFRNNDDPEPTVDDPALEVTWTAATGVILLFVGISAFFVLSNPYLTPAVAQPEAGEDALEVEVVAYQWGWQFRYPEANVTSSRLVLPVDRDVRFSLTSEDVLHSFFVPALGVKEDVFPGHERVARTRVTEPGTYRLYCAEFCGAGHSRMQTSVVVLNGSDYRAWIQERSTG